MDDDGASYPQTPTTDFATRFFNQLQEYKRLVLKFWWIPLVTVGVAVGIQEILLKHTAPMFESVGKMIVSVKLEIPNANVYSEELNNFFGTQVALMESDSVRNDVSIFMMTNHPDLPASPVSIDVSTVPKTSIFAMEARGSDAWYTQGYLAATMQEYIKLKKDLLENASSATQSAMEEELKALGIQLTNSKALLEEYQSNNSVVFLQPAGENSAAQRLATLSQRLADQQSELRLSESLTLDENLQRIQDLQAKQLVQTNSTAGSGDSQASGTSLIPDNGNEMPATLGDFEQDYLKTKQDIIKLQLKQKALSRLVATAPEMIELNQEIDSQQAMLLSFKDQSEEELKTRQHTMGVQITNLQQQVDEQKTKALEVSQKLSDYETLKDNKQRLQALYDQTAANLQTLDLNKGMGQESVTILEPASAPVPVPPQTRKHLVMASLIGLVLGIGILILINQLDDRIRSFTELEEKFDLPVLGQIPLVPRTSRKVGVKVLQPDDNRYPLIEAYRSLRSALLYKDLLKHEPVPTPKRIVVTSACPNDGKSMTATNLAITFAQAGARVLLVDTDMRRGRLHSHFSAAISPGMAEVLTGQCTWQAALIQTMIPNLHLLPCGTQPRHSQHVFATVDKFLKEIEGQYDYYVFDTAPVMAADDVLSLAPNMDGLILVIRAGFTPTRIAHAALNLLLLRKVNVLGIVFNAVPPKTSDFYYYRFKEYYSQAQTT